MRFRFDRIRNDVYSSTDETEVDESLRNEWRREVLKEVLDALAPDADWTSDDRFEHYPLDVQVALFCLAFEI